MNKTNSLLPLSPTTLNLVVLIVAALLSYQFVVLRFSTNNYYVGATPDMLLAGTAVRPFVYRVLMIWLVRGLTFIPVLSQIPPIAFFAFIEFIALISLVFAFRHYLLLFIPDRVVTSILAFSLFYVLPFNFLYTLWFSWDIPSILFFTLGLIALYRGQWKWYYLIFVLATLNRETSCFLTFVYLFTAFRKTSWQIILRHALVQFAIWFSIKLLLYWMFIATPANLKQGVFELEILENLAILSQPVNLLAFLKNWGLIWVPVLFLFRLIDDPFVRQSLKVVPLFLLSMFSVGLVVEMRIYGEVIPLLLTALSLILVKAIRRL